LGRTLVRIEPLQHLAAMKIREPLRRDAERAEPQGFLVNVPANQLANNRLQSLGIRANLVLHKHVQRLRGIDHFPGNQLSKPRRPAVIEEARQRPMGVIAESVPNRTLSGIEKGGARISQRPKPLLERLGWPDVVAIEADVLPAFVTSITQNERQDA